MLTKLSMKRFKQFEDVSIELGSPVVFVGPNNSGKTTALQALALWAIGVRRWSEKYGKREKLPKERRGVAVNRQDLLAVPVPATNLLWFDRRTHRGKRDNGTTKTVPYKIEIGVEGVCDDQVWSYRLEFDYANTESLYCRPIAGEHEHPPQCALDLDIAYLPPMSGLQASEALLPPGRINVLIGQGRTAEVLRNLCYNLTRDDGDGRTSGKAWSAIRDDLHRLFGVRLKEPRFIAERGELSMSYVDHRDIEFDISSAGRGLHQVLLLLAYMHSHERGVLLLDEPDAHLEILRQRHIYDILSAGPGAGNAQVVIASHSEVVLREAADRDLVVAFVGRHPHRIDSRRKNEVLQSLREIGYDQYYQAETRGWILYLEGSTDLSVLQAFAERLSHPAVGLLASPFAHYVGNDRGAARRHFLVLKKRIPT